MRDVVGSTGVVVAGDSIAAAAGTAILRRGGNAVDAAAASVLVECVVQPHNVGIAGYAGTMVLYSPDHDGIVSINFDSVAPLAARPDMFVSRHCSNNWDVVSDGGSVRPGANEHGYLSVTVPPIVAGLSVALERYGTMSFADVAEAAQECAQNGFTVYPALASALALFAAHADAVSVSALLPDGRVPEAGDALVQEDLARLIGVLRDKGPLAFYTGDIPRAIVREVQAGGGIIEEADFAAVAPEVGPAISVPCGDCVIHTPMPPAGGLTALQTIRVAQLAGLTRSDLCTPHYYRVMSEAARHAWADRFSWLGDPSAVDVPIDFLLSESRAAEILAKVESGVACRPITAAAGGGEHTVHLVAADAGGGVVSVTATHGSWFGSMVAVKGLGLVLGHGMSRFDPVPGRANSIAPGKRMQHNMSPLLITKGGTPYCAVGLPGGRRIVNVSALLGHSIAGLGLTCGEAIDLPRFHVEGAGPLILDCEQLADQMRRDYGDSSQVTLANRRIAGPVAGLMVDENDGGFLAASEVGPECVSTV